jgi:hypothetical protein
MILQVIIASVTAALITLKVHWARIKTRLLRKPVPAEEPPVEQTSCDSG